MRIMLLNQVYWPDRAATAQMAHDLARSLARDGFEVVAVAQRGGYEGDKDRLAPARETVEGVEIVRVGRNLFGRGSTIGRAIDMARFLVILGVRALTMKRADVVVTFTTPPLIGLVGAMIRLLRGSKHVHWSMDLYPDIPIAFGAVSASNPLVWLWAKLDRLALRGSDRVAVLGRCMGEEVVKKGVPRERVWDGGVWADDDEIEPVARADNPFVERWGIGDRFVVMYSGNYGMGHDMDTMLEAARRMQDRDDVLFLFVGGGTRKQAVEEFVATHELSNVQCHPYQDRAELGPLLSVGDVHLITHIESLVGMFVPSKTYGIMAAGRPSIFVGREDAEAGRTLVENDCGSIVRVGDVDGLIAEIDRLRADRPECDRLGANARAALEARYSRAVRCASWSVMLRELESGEGGGAGYTPRATAGADG